MPSKNGVTRQLIRRLPFREWRLAARLEAHPRDSPQESMRSPLEDFPAPFFLGSALAIGSWRLRRIGDVPAFVLLNNGREFIFHISPLSSKRSSTGIVHPGAAGLPFDDSLFRGSR